LNTLKNAKPSAALTAEGASKTDALFTGKPAGLCSARQAFGMARDAYLSDPPSDPNIIIEQRARLETMRRAAWGKARR
jgi:hypothetical protein